MGRREESVDSRCLGQALLAFEIVDGADGVEMRNHGGLLSGGEANWPTDTIGRSPRSNTGEITGFLGLPYGTFGPHMIRAQQNEGAQGEGLRVGQAGARRCWPSAIACSLVYPGHIKRERFETGSTYLSV